MCYLINGEAIDTLPLSNRSVQFGDGVFETCKVKNNSIILWEYHKKRLLKGVRKLDIHLDYSLLISEINTLLQQFNNGVLKIIISRGDSKRGYGYTDIKATRILITNSLPISRDIDTIVFCNTGYGLNKNLAGIKHQNRLEQIMALGGNNNTECIMLNTQEYVISTTSGNIFAFTTNGLITPDLSLSGIDGTRRAYIMDNYPVLVKHITKKELLGAMEVFTCNSVYGIRNILHINNTAYHTTKTKALKEKLNL